MSIAGVNIIDTQMRLVADQFVAGAKQANKAIDRLTKSGLSLQGGLTGLRSSLLGMAGPAAAAAAAALGVGIAINATVGKAIRLGEELFNLSQRTGETVENLSRLKFAADQEDVSMGQVASGLRIASQRAVEASRGSKEAAASFARLGVNVRDANGNLKSGTELLRDIGIGLKSIPAGTERTAAAVEVLGRSGTQLIPLLTNLDALSQEADELGAVISTEFAASADEFGDNIGKLRTLSAGFGIAIAESVLPALNNFLEDLIDIGTDALPKFQKAMDDSAFAINTWANVATIAGTAAEFVLNPALFANKKRMEEGKKAIQDSILELGLNKEAWLAQRDAVNESTAATEGNTEVVGEAKSALALLNEELAKFAQGPAEIATTTDFFDKFGDALDAGNQQLVALVENLARVAQVSPQAASALAQVQEAQRGRLEEGFEPRALPSREAAERERELTGEAPAPGTPGGGFLLPGGGQPVAQPGIIEDSATDAEALEAAILASDLAAESLNTTLSRGQEILGGFSSFADGLTTALISAAEGGKTAFQDFFKGLLKGLAAAIIRALILRALLSVFGGVPGIGKLLSAATGAAGTLGFQDQESSMLGRAAQARSFAAGLGGGQLAGAGGLPVPSVTVTPSVTVNQATPATWIEITDKNILPRLRTRQRRLNDDLG